jgi:hypothetical protein
MKINILYFIWILIKTQNIINTMRYFFNKYNIETFEVLFFWKVITFTKENYFCKSILSMESKTTWLSRYLNEYKYYPYAIINFDIINPIYFNIHNSLIKSFNIKKYTYTSIYDFIKNFPIYFFSNSYDKNKFVKIIKYIKLNKTLLIKKQIKYFIKNISNDESILFQFRKNILNYYNNEITENILFDNIYLILNYYYKIIQLIFIYQKNKQKHDITYIKLLNNINIDYLCIRQLPFTNNYVFMDLYESQLYFSYGLKKCLFKDILKKLLFDKKNEL